VVADPEVDAVDICTPNAQHFPLAKAAMEAGKHVICEKPLAISADQARGLVEMANAKNLANCTCHNLRYYPLVQHARRMREAGELGEILHVQGTYSQDWLLYDTDWNWRVEAKSSGPLRAMADIGSHWCDMLEHVSGERIAAVCADLATFHTLRNNAAVDTEDYGGVLFHLGARSRGSFTVSQVAAGRKNWLSVEIYGTRASAAWNQERPDELWIGHRNGRNEILLKDPALLDPRAAAYADLPGGHAEGYGDTFKQLFRRFYLSIADPGAPRDYPQFDAGLRQMRVLDAALASHHRRGWADVAIG
jgi:predicted dehydrogenase